jgi:hypothetical protein
VLGKTSVKNVDTDVLEGANDEIEYWAAIIIGGPYRPGMTPPTQFINDAQAMNDLLIKRGWKRQNIKMVSYVGMNIHKRDILNGIDWLEKNEDENDVVLLFFSIHGDKLPGDIDGDEPDGADECIRPVHGFRITDDELGEMLDEFDSHKIVAIFNTCHSGGMIDGDNDLKGDGRVILCSSTPDEYSYSFQFWEDPWHTLFSYYVIEGLKGEADENENNNVSAEEAFSYAKSAVIRYLDEYNENYSDDLEQTPQIYDGYPTELNNEGELNIIDLSKQKKQDNKVRSIHSLLLKLLGQKSQILSRFIRR